jgi:hypothetical protein
MYKILFIVSHLGSGSDVLCNILDKNSRIKWFHPNVVYDHPFKLETLTGNLHKLRDSSAIWMDHLLQNYYLTNKSVYKFVKFIFVLRDAKSSLNAIVKNKEDADSMFRYYVYRLRRICEMAKLTNGLCLTWNSLSEGRGLHVIKDYLSLRDDLKLESFYIPKYNPLVTSDLIDAAQESYERHLFYLQANNLIQ